MNEHKRESRRRQVVEKMKDGKPLKDIGEELQTSRTTLWRDLKALDNLFITENSEQIKELKRKVGHALLESADNVLSGALLPDRANAWRGIMADFSQLFGLNAPTKSVSTNVNVDARGPYYEFLAHADKLTREQLEEVFRFMDALPRPEVKFMDLIPASLLPKKLGEGND